MNITIYWGTRDPDIIGKIQEKFNIPAIFP